MRRKRLENNSSDSTYRVEVKHVRFHSSVPCNLPQVNQFTQPARACSGEYLLLLSLKCR
jgi:hypothetical protein